MAAEDLLHVGGDFIALVGAVALDDRGQQPDQHVGLFALFLGLGLVGQVDLQRAPQAQGPHAFGEGLGVHQHAAHIGVHEDRVGLRLGFRRAGQSAALPAIERIGDRVLIGDLGLAETLDADAETRSVHHDEHRGEALVLLAHEPALRAIVIEHASGVAVDAHLVLDRTADHAVALADRAVVADEELGHDEQRDALAAVGCAGGLRQHEVDDVLRHVVFAGRDEDLGPGDRIAAVGLRFGLGPDHPQIRPAMRFGQVHRTGPFVGDHLGKIFLLLLLAALGEQRGDRPVGQAGIHAEGLVGARHEFLEGEAEDMRHALPAELFGLRQRAPAPFAELIESFLETLGRGDRTVFVAGAAFLVARLVQRGEHFGAELAAFVDHRIGDIDAGGLEAGQVGIAGEIEHLVDDEAGVAGRRGVTGHLRVLRVGGCRL